MKTPTKLLKWFIAFVLGAAVTTLAYCFPFWPEKKIDFELTGTVRNFDTNEPIEGAYVMAIYETVRGGDFVVGTAHWCIKTRGMTTGKDGTFHFPVEKLDGWSPSQVTAIKPGYFLRRVKLHSEKIQHADGKENYTGRDVFLLPQVEGKPDFRLGTQNCRSPLSREAAEANISYLEIIKSEYERLKRGETYVQNIDSMISRLRDAPSDEPKSK